MKNENRPNVNVQEKVVIHTDGRGHFLVSLPDGFIQNAASKKKAENIAKRWFAKNAKASAINVGRIDWMQDPIAI